MFSNTCCNYSYSIVYTLYNCFLLPLQLYRDMIGAEVERDVHVYTTMMRACAKERQLERALLLMDELEVSTGHQQDAPVRSHDSGGITEVSCTDARVLCRRQRAVLLSQAYSHGLTRT
jgi:pentatricopeptide repeat protein